MNENQRCLSDELIAKAFKTHLNIDNDEELSTIVTRFYGSYYVRGKSLRVAVRHTVLNNYIVPTQLIAELEYITALY